MMNDPLAVEISFSVSSSFGYIALTDVERWSSGARSALPCSIAIAGFREGATKRYKGEHAGSEVKKGSTKS
jgi:hypothetical protein